MQRDRPCSQLIICEPFPAGTVPTLIGHGLNKIRHIFELDTPSTLRMIAKVAHLMQILHHRSELDCFIENVRATRLTTRPRTGSGGPSRTEHLVTQGLARHEGTRVITQPNLLSTLRRREIDAAGDRLSAERGLPYTPPASGETVSGTYCQRLSLTSAGSPWSTTALALPSSHGRQSSSGISAAMWSASPRRAGSNGVSSASAGCRSEWDFSEW
jgi:ribosomal protein L30/L7E